MSEPQPLNVAFPPDFVFKFPRNRYVPSQEVVMEQSIFNFEKMKYPSLKDKPNEFFEIYGYKKDQFDFNLTPEEEKMGGQLAYFTGVPYPSKGHPFPQMMYAVNQAKRFTKTLIAFLPHKDMKWTVLGFLFSSSKSKRSIVSRLLKSYTEVCGRSMNPYILNEEFMSPCAREIELFIGRFLKKLGIDEWVSVDFPISFSMMFANQIEADNVYRLRVEDAMSETTKEMMLKNPRKELDKMRRLLIEHDPDWQTARKFEQALGLLRLVLLVPKYKRIFRECIQESNFGNFQYDEADRYHTLLIWDYNFQGLSIEERVKIYREVHGVDEEGKPTREGGSLPMRIMIQTKQQ